MRVVNRVATLVSCVAMTLVTAGAGFAGDNYITTAFKGPKADTGYATVAKMGNTTLLTWADEFKIPDRPAPHWQVVDSKGNVYLLQRLKIKGEKENRSVQIPAYIHDVVKVQIWWAWAEALLGESTFDRPVMVASAE